MSDLIEDNFVVGVCVPGGQCPLCAVLGDDACGSYFRVDAGGHADDLRRSRGPFLNAPIRFWRCPINEHRNRRGSKGRPVQEVEWVDGVATCLFPGCGRTSTYEETPS